MIRNLLIGGALISTAFVGWHYGSPTESVDSLAVVKVDENLDSGNLDPISELTEDENQQIIDISKKIPALTHVSPIPIPKMPNIGQSIKLPKLKTLTENDLGDPSLDLNLNRSVKRIS